MNWPKKTFLLLLLLAIVLRLPYLSMSFYGDEAEGWVLPAKTFHDLGIPLEMGDKSDMSTIDLIKWGWHPPMALYLYSFAVSFPFSLEVSLRSIPFLLSLASLVILYFIAKENYSEKTALLAFFIAAVSTYHIFHSSIRIDIDGGILSFFVTAAIYTYLRWQRSRDNLYYLLLTGLLLGLCLLSRTSSILVVGFFLLYEATSRNLKTTAMLGGVSLGIFSLWLAGTYLAGNEAYIQQVFGWSNPLQEPETALAFITHRLPGLYTIVRGLSPPLLTLLIISFLRLAAKLKRKNILQKRHFPWLFILLVCVMVVLPSHGEKQRYFTIALPMVFLAVANLLKTYSWKESRNLIMASFLLFFILYALFPPYDHLIHEYMLYGSLLPLLAWALPFALLFFHTRKPVVPILFGCYLAFCSTFLLYDCSANKAYADAVEAVKQSTNVVIANRNNINTNVYGYDWLQNGKIDSGNTYIQLQSYDEIRQYERNSSCVKFAKFRYPLNFVCSKTSTI